MHIKILYKFHSGAWVLVGKLSRVRNLPSYYISYTNIEIPMEWSQLTGFRLIQFWSGWRPVVYCISKQIDIFHQVWGLGWVYLATEGIRILYVMARTRPDLLGWYRYGFVEQALWPHPSYKIDLFLFMHTSKGWWIGFMLPISIKFWSSHANSILLDVQSK
jgi:hypothetical protein